MCEDHRDVGITGNLTKKLFKVVFVIVSNEVSPYFRIKTDGEDPVAERAKRSCGQPGIVLLRTHKIPRPAQAEIKNIFR